MSLNTGVFYKIYGIYHKCIKKMLKVYFGLGKKNYHCKKDKMLHVVLGASPNERRYSFKATELLSETGYDVIPVGIRKGEIMGLQIQKEFPEQAKIHTIGMYLSADNQEKYKEFIFKNLPKRIIFNPGTYNPEFQKTLIEKGVEVVNDCVLLMVNSSRY